MSASDQFATIAAPVEAELEVKRSRFLCRLVPVSDEPTARAEVEAVRKKHWDARHHCSAFVLGPDAATERSSDDGEPSGTAGAPMLEVLRGAGLSDLVAIVTRWFGGTLLGTGGLVRAYGDAVRLALAEARVRQVRLLHEVMVSLDPATAGRVEAELRGRGHEVLDTIWSEQVEVRLAVRPDDRGGLEATLAELTGGAVHLSDGPQRWV